MELVRGFNICVFIYLFCTYYIRSKHRTKLTAPAKKEKKGKEPEAPILYEDPPDKTTSKDGREANMKITSWNVDGLRAWVKKKGLDVRNQMQHLLLHFSKAWKIFTMYALCFFMQWVRSEDSDVLCLQETKCAEKSLPSEITDMPEYPHKYWAGSEDKEGYSGVAMLCKTEPLNVTYGIGKFIGIGYSFLYV